MKRSNLMIALAALLTAMPLAQAADNMANRMPTNLPGVTTAIHPPEGFNPVEASDEELAIYGFPPRPDANEHPDSYAKWVRAMRASKVRITPELQLTDVFHGASKLSKTDNFTGTSNNWSASVNLTPARSYNQSNSFYFLLTDYVVPVATQAYGACTGGWDYSSSWIGIDGWGSGDVLQGGTESDAFCALGGLISSTFYSPWFEWYPAGSVRISNFPVNPGDDIFLEVWNTSSTQGYAYYVNYNTNQTVEVGFTAPSGTYLVGNSAEWVVERPGVNGGLATLTNYISDYFSDCYAYTWSYTTYTPGSASALQVTMLDNNGYAISYPTLLGSTGIWFQDEGGAR